MPVLDLVDCIKPGSVVYDNVASGTDEEVREREKERGLHGNMKLLVHAQSLE